MLLQIDLGLLSQASLQSALVAKMIFSVKVFALLFSQVSRKESWDMLSSSVCSLTSVCFLLPLCFSSAARLNRCWQLWSVPRCFRSCGSRGSGCASCCTTQLSEGWTWRSHAVLGEVSAHLSLRYLRKSRRLLGEFGWEMSVSCCV